VRFGNVLGSSGSVVPQFERQWRRHQRLRVTSERATRYFMTVEEAVSLILHAESLRDPGEVYVLDMGEPVRILDMARQLVRQKGGAQEVDRHIDIVGLRPGEREHERLHSEAEVLEETGIPKIRNVVGLPVPDPEWANRLERLERLVDRMDETEVRAWLLRTREAENGPGSESE